MNFQVYYSASTLPKHERPLDAVMIEHCFSCLEMDIHTRLIHKGVVSGVHIVRDMNQAPEYAEVSLDDGGQGVNLPVTLTDCLGEINRTRNGLCFLSKQLP